MTMNRIIFSHNMFAVCRGEFGTLGAIQNMMTVKEIPHDDQVPLLFSIADLSTLRDMEMMEAKELYLLIDSLCEGWKDGNAINEEMMVNK